MIISNDERGSKARERERPHEKRPKQERRSKVQREGGERAAKYFYPAQRPCLTIMTGRFLRESLSLFCSRVVFPLLGGAQRSCCPCLFFCGRQGVVIMIWQQWEGTATTVANPSTSPPGPHKAILAQGHFCARQFWAQGHFWLKAMLAQGHQMVVLGVALAMGVLMVIVMNDVGDGDDRSISMVLP